MDSDKRGFVALAFWAASHHVVVKYDDLTDVASFTYRRRSIQLPLGAKEVIVSGKTIGLKGKCIAARGSRWFVPKAELDLAVGNGLKN